MSIGAHGITVRLIPTEEQNTECSGVHWQKVRNKQMINLELGELYGMDNVKELMQTIEELRSMGMSDAEIQAILERSKEQTE